MKLFIEIFNSFSNKEKKTFIFVLFFTIIVGFLETLSIGSLIPMVSILAEDNSTSNIHLLNPILKSISPLNFFKTELSSNYQTILFFGALTLVFLILLVKTIFLQFTNFIKFNFIFLLKKNISKNLFLFYLKTDYLNFAKQNSSEYLRNISIEVSNYINLVSIYYTVFFECLFLFGMILILLIINPFQIFFISFLIFSISLIFYYLMKKKIKTIGDQRFDAEAKKIKYLQQGFEGFREINIYNKHDQFISLFDLQSKIETRSNAIANFFRGVPRSLLELTGFLILIFIISFYFINELSTNTILLKVAIMAVCIIRIIPIISSLIASFQQIKYYELSSKKILKELNILKKKNESYKIYDQQKGINIKLKNELFLKDINFKYPESKEYLFQNLNLKINKNSIVGIQGESGSGKSTLIDLILGFLEPSSGKIYVDQLNVGKNIEIWQKNLSFVPQKPFILDDTIKNNIIFGDKNINQDLLENSVKNSGCQNFVNNLDEKLNFRVGERGNKLSGGQIQRIAIARALYNNTQILIFDEFTSALDNETEVEILEQINRLKMNKTIIISSHKISTLKICDEVFSIKNKKIIKV